MTKLVTNAGASMANGITNMMKTYLLVKFGSYKVGYILMYPFVSLYL